MKTSLIFLVSFLISFTTWARKTDGQFVFTKEDDVLILTPKKGYHLNKDAPASVVYDELEALYKPTKKLEKGFEFKIVKGAKKAKVAFYMCDDQNTVCEQQQETVSLDKVVGGTAAEPTAEVVKDLSASFNPNEKKKIKKDAPIVLNPSKPTLYMFSAPWCPACLRMVSETLNKTFVQQELKKVNFVKLNSDLPDNHELSERYGVKAIPTLVLVDNKGQELFRWLDYQEAQFFVTSLKQAVKDHKDGKDLLTDRAKIGDQVAISQLGMMAYNALDCATAAKWLHLSKEAKDQKFKLASDVMCAESTEDYEPTLLKAMTLTTSQVDRLRWFVDYVENLKEKNRLEADVRLKTEAVETEIAELQKNSQASAKAFKESTYGENSGFEWAELQLLRMKIQNILGREKRRDELAQQLIVKLKAKPTSPARPGEMLLKIAYLREAGEKQVVEKMYRDLISKNSKSYVYYEKFSRFLLTQKRYDESLNEVEMAMKFPEGNRPQLYLLKSRVLKESNKADLAKQTIQEAMALGEIKHERYKKIQAQLKKLQDDIEASTKK